MSNKQDKATTEKHAKMLREMLKNPDNKVCADCKRNDPRWASWNIGVFLCIRCSGIHRSMGTHISKVKSVDLDVWTPEQMASIKKWGNRRANAYWEAHLKAGHVPPDHKMDSFIRSKYESRRWAMDGPPPSDPSVLDSGTEQQAPAPSPAPASISTSASSSRASHTSTHSTSSVRSPVTTRQPQPHQLLSTAVASRNAQAAARSMTPLQQQQQPQAPASAPAPSAANDLFSLDFHNPTPPANVPEPKKDVKQDILSLFSTTAAAPAQPAFGQFGAASVQVQNAWGQFNAAPVAPAAPVQPTSMMGTAGPGAWGTSSGWTGQPAVSQTNIWASASSPTAQQPPIAQQSLFNTSDIWASSTAPSTGAASANLFGSAPATKKDDVFGDIWGGFK